MTVFACGHRYRAERAHAELSAAAQRVVLRPVPQRIGPIRTEVSYLPAGRAWAGGDLYDAVATPYGVRLIIGDVMGKGHDAVERAADVLGAFRELAHHEATLEGIAIRLDSFLCSRDECEQFVTALFVEIPAPDGPGEGILAELVSCGHPPPLVLSDGSAAFADPLVPSPPLGLMGLTDGWCVPSFIDLVPGSALLLYTDGVSEARDRSGTFYPLANRVALLAAAVRDPLVDKLTRDLNDHTDGRRHDDAALLLARFEPSVVGAPASTDGRSM
jgi:serine phosphatase RsbU (regulator of sigma subunit)